jgi:hypothetical protein
LKLYGLSRAGRKWLGKDRAVDEKLSSEEPVHAPCLSIFGMSTEELFFKGLTDENLLDGLVSRLTVIHVSGRALRQRISHDPRPPARLLTAYRDALQDWPVSTLGRGKVGQALLPPEMVPVGWENESVRDTYEKFELWQDDTIAEDPAKDAYMSRAAEQAQKLAIIRAVSRDAISPKITIQDWNWGQAFVTRSIEMMEVATKRYMAGSDFEDLYKRMLEYCRVAGDDGLKPSELRRKPGMSKIEPRRYNDAIQFLSTNQMWQVRQTGKKGNRFFTIDGMEMVEDGEE